METYGLITLLAAVALPIAMARCYVKPSDHHAGSVIIGAIIWLSVRLIG